MKIVTPGHMSALVDGWIRLHPEGFRVEHPSRRVNSLYYDTVNWDSLRDNAAGVSERNKMRLRWYGRPGLVEGMQFEIKSRRAGLVYKQAEPVPGQFAFDESLSWFELTAVVSEASQLFCNDLRLLVPAIMTTYQRDYYATFDGRVRLTVDTDISYHRVTGSSRAVFSPVPIDDEVTVIEVKGGPSESKRIAEITRALPLRIGRNSKFVNGILASFL
jgi:hypothetical protein